MMRLILIAACFFLFQNVSLADESERKPAGLQRNELPRVFLPKIGSEVTINKKGDSLSLGTSGSTLEEILQRIAEARNVTLRFHCDDPSINQERGGNQTISGDSLVKILQQLLPPDCRFSLLDPNGKETESSKDIASINIYPKGCAGTAPPVRVFVGPREQRLWTKTPEETLLEELQNALKRQGPSSRRGALDILGIKGDERGIPYAKEGLKDPNLSVMLAAANALRRLGHKFGPEKVGDAIYERFLEKPYADFLPILADVGKDRFFAVIEGLMDQPGEKEKGIMARALLLTRDKRAIKYLSIIASTSSIENSRQAIYAMGRIGGPEAASILLSLLREGDSQQQAMAVQAVSFLPPGEGAEARAEIEKAVQEGRLSDQALQVLVAIPYLEPLEKLMKDPASKPALKVRVLRAMSVGRSEITIKVMSLGLNDEALQVRLATVEAMGASGGDAAIPYLVKATEDKDAKIREAAARGLADFPGDPNAAKGLAKAMYDEDGKVRRSAVDALSTLGEPSGDVTEILKDCEKNHKDPYVAMKAGHILRTWKLN
jgi:HEAT repeat protein